MRFAAVVSDDKAPPALLVPTANVEHNQHEENEILRVGTFLDSIVTIAAVLRMGPS